MHLHCTCRIILGEMAMLPINIHGLFQGCELDRFLTEFKFEFKKHLQVRVQVRVLSILFFEFEFGKNDRVQRV